MHLTPSNYLRPRQTREMLRAGRHAYYIGRPLNWQITIDFGWPDAGGEYGPYRRFQVIRKKVWSWWSYLRRQGVVAGAFLDWATWEAPSGNHHVNWLVSVPDHLLPTLERVVESRCRKVMGALMLSDTIHQQEIYNVNGLMFYALKGSEPDYAEKVGIDPEPQGRIWCRRASPSRALGRAARERDWKMQRIVQRPKAGIPKPREAREIIRKGGVVLFP